LGHQPLQALAVFGIGPGERFEQLLQGIILELHGRVHVDPFVPLLQVIDPFQRLGVFQFLGFQPFLEVGRRLDPAADIRIRDDLLAEHVRRPDDKTFSGPEDIPMALLFKGELPQLFCYTVLGGPAQESVAGLDFFLELDRLVECGQHFHDCFLIRR